MESYFPSTNILLGTKSIVNYIPAVCFPFISSLNLTKYIGKHGVWEQCLCFNMLPRDSDSPKNLWKINPGWNWKFWYLGTFPACAHLPGRGPECGSRGDFPWVLRKKLQHANILFSWILGGAEGVGVVWCVASREKTLGHGAYPKTVRNTFAFLRGLP